LIGPSNTQGAVSWSQRSAPRKVSVRQWPCGGEASQAFAFRPPAAQWRHVGLDPGLVDEDQSPRIEPRLPGSPAAALARDIGAGLLKGEQCFF